MSGNVDERGEMVLRADQTLNEALQLFIRFEVNEVPIIDHQRREIGRLTCRTLLKAVADKWDGRTTIESLWNGEKEAEQVGREPADAPKVSRASVSELTAMVERLKRELQETQSIVETMKTVLDSAYEGIVVVDAHGIIQEINKAYCQFLGIRREDAVGKHVTEVIENTRLHICLESGIPERGFIQKIYGQPMVVHRIPIWRDGKVIGAIGVLIFQGVSEVYQIFKRLQDLSREASRKEEKEERAAPSRKQIFGLNSIIGRSPVIAEIKQMVRRAARVPSTVLITGESGTGKEVLAKAIHQSSPYADGNFISVNCAAIPESLLEAELFGYEEGAFTGAKKGGKPGKFQLAHKGTLFLDEIGDMPLYMQAKILRVLEEKKVERVGGVEEMELDVRIIAATNKNLEEMVRKGQFREDLFYRLNIIRIHIPALRERKMDIPYLLAYHMERICEQFGLKQKEFTKEAMQVLMDYSWPGNIRELVNVVEWLVGMVDGQKIQKEHLPAHILSPQRLAKHGDKEGEKRKIVVQTDTNWREIVDAYERERIKQALIEERGNKAAAARKLGMHRSTLYEKLKKYNL
ncbi:sigma-54-dependent Fis family transcriptional regulator [Geobacillus sp. 44B]|jgi:transcriptional regulator with PAS, ATPase and Fis domain|uniref:sigma-54-dependent Fis family transcriptional regulator n=1 Tax=Saccharococcus caldoxylosilyticus TaxID=81408 RepID=UPI0002DD250C|nr:sigma-54-dependent Fis family transcriptional regulator [Parageobacillus caldoxylosilyticus]OQO99497.1 sigma-54-dependent Fis family transcriptional regulator [Geobacillus sp. 44B]QNU36921.1 sigma-54-dependent Fis family transcriptional regulator [Geobacillus sp. 44B]